MSFLVLKIISVSLFYRLFCANVLSLWFSREMILSSGFSRETLRSTPLYENGIGCFESVPVVGSKQVKRASASKKDAFIVL